jgi:hypothetical protein
MVSHLLLMIRQTQLTSCTRTNALPSFKDNLAKVSLKNPIEQQMVGRAGLFRQQNVEKRKTMSMRDWAELCARDEFRAPSANGTGSTIRAVREEQSLHARRDKSPFFGSPQPLAMSRLS